MKYRFKHKLEGKETLMRTVAYKKEEFISLVSEAWALYCESKGWNSDIIDGYTTFFKAFDNSGNEIYYETFGE